MVSRDLKVRTLKRLVEYHGRLIDRGFSGRVTMRYERGVLQPQVRKEQIETLTEETL